MGEKLKKVLEMSVLGLLVSFSFCCSDAGYVRIEAINIPDYVDLTDKVSSYPIILKAIVNPFSANISFENYMELSKLLNTDYIKVNRSIYRVHLVSKIGVHRTNATCSVKLTSEELKDNPSLNLSLYYSKVEEGDTFTAESTPAEILKIRELIEKKGRIIKFGEECFEIFYTTRIVVREIFNPDKCMEANEGLLNNYPFLKKGLEMAEKSCLLYTSPSPRD